MHEKGTSYSLLRRASQEQADAWDQIVHLYAPLVYRWCRTWGAQATDAENICQEVFRALLTSLPSFRETDRPESFRAWLKAIARHKMVDQMRVWQRGATACGGGDATVELNQVPDLHDFDQDNETSVELRMLYRQAVELIRSEFSEQDWESFVLVTVDTLSPAETARRLGISVNSVYLAKSRIVKRVREEFGYKTGQT